MCGILGISGPRGPGLVEQWLPTLAHRGPDGQGIWPSPELTLGHRRLAIIGLDDGGAQPMVDANSGHVLVFNGEIYNYLEIADRLEAAGRQVDRRYDTSVLLAALETWGLEALADLNGMFALAWYRPDEQRLLLARDRWGKKPLFWGQVELDDGRRALVFCSEFRVFRQLPGGPPPTDPLGVARYLVYDGMPDERTVYRGVSKLPPASWLELTPAGDTIARGRYWQLDQSPHLISAEVAEATVTEQLTTALKLRLRSDVPVGLFLSGGLDSSLLGVLWRLADPEATIRTFTVGFEDPSYDERWSADVLATAIDAEHYETVISDEQLTRELDFVWDHLSEPFADPSIVPMSLLCRFARQTVTVALGGDGADELQAGYDPFRAWRPARIMESILPRQVWYAATRAVEQFAPVDPSNMSLRFKARHFSQGLLHPPDERIQGWLASFPVPMALQAMHPDLAREVDADELLAPTRMAFELARRFGEIQAQVKTWVDTYLECSILTKVDRASMMHSLEVRSPFLDPVLARTLAQLPGHLIFSGGKGKALLRRIAESRLPIELMRKPKKGFGVPQATWLRTVLRERFEACLEQTRGGGWFRHDVIERMWREHLAHKTDYRRALWNFLFSFPFQRL